MSSARVLRRVVAPVLFIGSLQNSASQSTDLPKREKTSAVHSPAPQEQAAPLLGAFSLEWSRDNFGIRSHGIIERTASGLKLYSLPQSNVETYKKLRAADLKYMLPRVLAAKDYQGQEVIGPYQVEGSRIWFGNQYYDSEGERGVGAFGYFETKTRKYALFSPPEIARWEVSALLVEPHAIWLALDHFGEDISTSPGGLIRWSRDDHRVQYYPLEFVIDRVRRDRRDPAMLFLMTRGGYALFQNGNVQRFLVQKSSDGNDAVIRINRFPPPPTIQ